MTSAPNGPRGARALFVLGVPRSGTTLIGNYLGSQPGVENLAEYGGVYVAYSIPPRLIPRLPGLHHQGHPTRLPGPARLVFQRKAREHECDSDLEHTPL